MNNRDNNKRAKASNSKAKVTNPENHKNVRSKANTKSEETFEDETIDDQHLQQINDKKRNKDDSSRMKLIVEQHQKNVKIENFINPTLFTENNLASKLIQFSEFLFNSNSWFITFTASLGEIHGFTRFVSVLLYTEVNDAGLNTVNAIIFNPFEELPVLNHTLNKLKHNKFKNADIKIGNVYIDNLDLTKDNINNTAKGLHMCNLILLYYRDINFSKVIATRFLDLKYVSQLETTDSTTTWVTVINTNITSEQLFKNNQRDFIGANASRYHYNDKNPGKITSHTSASDDGLLMPRDDQLTSLNYMTAWYISWMNVVLMGNFTLKNFGDKNGIYGVFPANAIPNYYKLIFAHPELKELDHFPAHAISQIEKKELAFNSKETYEDRIYKALKSISNSTQPRLSALKKLRKKSNQTKASENQPTPAETPATAVQPQEEKLSSNLQQEDKPTVTAESTVIPVAPAPEMANPSPKTTKVKPLSRVIVPYSANVTSSVESTLASKKLTKLSSVNELLAGYKDEILLHASRRVDLFFVLLVAYYNKKITPSLHKTVLQHGKASNKSNRGDDIRFSAAHRSLITSLRDNNTSRWLLDGTHLQNELNATDLLPHFVNEFDSILELDRIQYLKIIEDVSFGKIDPIKGLLEFLLTMQRAIANINVDTFKHPGITKGLIKLTEEASFSHTLVIVKNRDAINPNFLHASLELNIDEINQHTNNHTLEKLYLNKIKSIQTVVLSKKTRRDIDHDKSEPEKKFKVFDLTSSNTLTKAIEPKDHADTYFKWLKEKFDTLPKHTQDFNTVNKLIHADNVKRLHQYNYALKLTENNQHLGSFISKMKLVDQKYWLNINELKLIKKILSDCIAPKHDSEIAKLESIHNEYTEISHRFKLAIEKNLSDELIKDLGNQKNLIESQLVKATKKGILFNLSIYKKVSSELSGKISKLTEMQKSGLDKERIRTLRLLLKDQSTLNKVIYTYTQSIIKVFSNADELNPNSAIQSKKTRLESPDYLFHANDTLLDDDSNISEVDDLGRDEHHKDFQEDIAAVSSKPSSISDIKTHNPNNLSNPNNPALYKAIQAQKKLEQALAKQAEQKQQQALKLQKKQEDEIKAKAELLNFQAALNLQTEDGVELLHKQICATMGDKTSIDKGINLLTQFKQKIKLFVPKDNALVSQHTSKLLKNLTDRAIQLENLAIANQFITQDPEALLYVKIYDYYHDFMTSFQKQLTLLLNIKDITEPQIFKEHVGQLNHYFNEMCSTFTYSLLKQFCLKNDFIMRNTSDITRLIKANKIEYSILNLFYQTNLVTKPNPCELMQALEECYASSSNLVSDVDNIERLPLSLVHSLKVSLAMDPKAWTEAQLHTLKLRLPNLFAILRMTNLLHLNFFAPSLKPSTNLLIHSTNDSPSQQRPDVDSDSQEEAKRSDRGFKSET